MAAFLGKSYSDEVMAKLTEHLKFDNFQKNESVNNESGKKMGAMNEDGRFIRKGVCCSMTYPYYNYMGYLIIQLI